MIEASRPSRVSVVMPTYRQAKFLPRSLRSLLDQDFTDWELVIVDDGSDDDTQAVLQPFLGDPRITVIRFEHNQGLGRALNAGIDASNAELIAYLPSDDVWYPEHLASLVALLDHEPEVILAHSGVRHSYNRYATDQAPGECLQLVRPCIAALTNAGPNAMNLPLTTWTACSGHGCAHWGQLQALAKSLASGSVIPGSVTNSCASRLAVSARTGPTAGCGSRCASTLRKATSSTRWSGSPAFATARTHRPLLTV
jgi:GT2 family glycosyltransferase